MAAGSLPAPDPSLGGVCGTRNGTGLRLGIVAARWNLQVTARLVRGAQQAMADLGVEPSDTGLPADAGDSVLAWAPGSFELPVVAKAMAASGRFDAVVAIGAVVRGETTHYDLVSESAADGLMRAGLDTGVPVIFGVIATENDEQALARSTDGPSNKGYEAVLTAVETVTLLRALGVDG